MCKLSDERQVVGLKRKAPSSPELQQNASCAPPVPVRNVESFSSKHFCTLEEQNAWLDSGMSILRPNLAIESTRIDTIPGRVSRYQKLQHCGKDTLGAGAYGVVYRARDESTGRLVALKHVTQEYSDINEKFADARREAGILASLNHTNIVKLLDRVTDRDHHYMVYELMDSDLHKQLSKATEPLPLMAIRSYMRQLLLALEFCHANCILHRDVKPQNILVN